MRKVECKKHGYGAKIDYACDVHHIDELGVELGGETAPHHTTPRNDQRGVAHDVEQQAQVIQGIEAKIGDDVLVVLEVDGDPQDEGCCFQGK